MITDANGPRKALSNTQRHTPRVIALMILAATPLAAARSADAPQAATAPAEGQLQEVTVTARYVREDLQKTPIAITSLSAEQLEARGADNITSIAAEAPDVTLMTGGSTYGKSAQAFIRGVGQINFNLAFEPAVGFYVDDVYRGAVFGSLFELDDVDHVNVLRGPQGTLFGKSNEGGAILIYTGVPGPDTNGYAELGYGNYGHERARVAFDLTLVPNQLYVRVAAGMDNTDGWFTRYDYACAHPATAGTLVPLTVAPNCELGTEGGDDVNVARLTVRYVPNDDLEVILRGSLMDDRGEADPTKLLAVNNAPGTGINDYNNNVAIPMFGVPLDSRFITNSPYTSYATYQEPSTGRTIPPISTNYAVDESLVVNWNAPGGIHVKNVLGYEHLQGKFAIDGTESPIPDFVILQGITHEQITEELDVSGHLFNNKVDWTAGGYYYDANGAEGGGGGYALLPGLEIVPPQGAGSPFAPNGYYGLDFYENDPVHDHDVSGFLHAVFHVTDALSVEAGVRYTDQSKTYTFVRTALATDPVDPLFPAGEPVSGLYNIGATAKTDRVDPKLALQYQWTPDLMTYVQVATGYKGAGINSQPVFASDVTPFAAETLIAYEIGAKSEWFDKRLRANVALFHSDYKNLQQNTYTADGSNQTIDTGKMYIDGFEVELDAVPVRDLQIDAGIGMMRFDTVDLGLAADQPADIAPTLHTQPPYVPKTKVNGGVQYTIHLGTFGDVTPRLDAVYQSTVYNDPTNSSLTRQGGYTLFNGRVSFSPIDSHWVLAVEAKNLAQKVYYVNMTDFLPSYGTLDAQPGPPRMILGTIKYTF
jgi:iron complex outermembrane receptor protein